MPYTKAAFQAEKGPGTRLSSSTHMQSSLLHHIQSRLRATLNGTTRRGSPTAQPEPTARGREGRAKKAETEKAFSEARAHAAQAQREKRQAAERASKQAEWPLLHVYVLLIERRQETAMLQQERFERERENA